MIKRTLTSVMTVGALVAAAVVPPSVAAAAPAGTRAGGRGALVSATPLTMLATPSAVTAKLASDGFRTGTQLSGVRTYRLVYRTVDPAGRPTVASGLLALPLAGRGPLPVVSFAHGTESYRLDAPSVSDDGFVTDPAITYASAGFAAVSPDYLGLGTGPGHHPWMDLDSETTAEVDMLHAAHSFSGRVGREVYATGFSQGASAALGLGRALRDGDRYFRLAALAPVSGAYDIRGSEIPAVLSGQVIPQLATVYMAYLFVSWNRLHHLYRDPAQVFRQPYAGEVDRLFDGDTPGEDMLAALPGTVEELLTPAGLTMLRHPAGAFAAAIRHADGVCDWHPTVPVRLLFSPGDGEAVNANTTACDASFAKHGLNVRTIDLGDDTAYDGMVHEGSEILGVAATVRWFRRLAAA